MKNTKTLQLYWEDINERVLYAGLDDYAWKLPEKIFHYKKKYSLYIFHHNKLAAYYSKSDSIREAVIGIRFYKHKANIKKVICLKKRVKQEVAHQIQDIYSKKLNKISDNELKKYIIHALNLFQKALSIHYLTQPQFFEKFETRSTRLSLKDIRTISQARFKYSRIAWTDALKLCKKLLTLYGKRHGISLKYLESFTYDEIFRNALNRRVASKRINSFAIVSNNHHLKLFTGNKVKKFIQTFETIKKTNTIKGIIGNPGIIQGKAYILKNENLDLKRLPRGMKKGMVLIVQNAWPEFTNYYSSASALVTNEGGITSHGVVVSRELGIPCIVGTKIATKVFKDGDRVEVDAIKGIVKRI